jgi:peroxiredoxin
MRLIALTALVTAAIPAFAMPPLPRKAPEFTITEGPGKESLLTSYRGKVVVLAFVHTTCIHCQAFSGVLTRLHKELGPRGFQPIDVAWNPDAEKLVPGFVKDIGIDFPVGHSDWDPIMSFMGFSMLERPVVPLVVVIDRKGMIRAQSPAQGDPNLQDEGKLRALIESLLNEGATSKAGKAKN